ncbi:hypothetical protein N7513_010481 [Penicillium frequentans]|nr:hypothetical protein N7513_010481 [Penicillium glabrum]
MFERSNVLQAFHGRSCATGEPRPASQQGRSITWLPREMRGVEDVAWRQGDQSDAMQVHDLLSGWLD